MFLFSTTGSIFSGPALVHDQDYAEAILNNLQRGSRHHSGARGTIAFPHSYRENIREGADSIPESNRFITESNRFESIPESNRNRFSQNKQGAGAPGKSDSESNRFKTIPESNRNRFPKKSGAGAPGKKQFRIELLIESFPNGSRIESESFQNKKRFNSILDDNDSIPELKRFDF